MRTIITYYTYNDISDLPKVLCPMCGKFGLVRMMIPSTYYPKFCSMKCILLEEAEEELAKDPSSEYYKERVAYFRKMVKGSKYRERSKKHLSVSASDYIEYVKAKDDPNRKKSLYRVTYRIYPYFYIGHYDKELYNKQMERKRNGDQMGEDYARFLNHFISVSFPS